MVSRIEQIRQEVCAATNQDFDYDDAREWLGLRCDRQEIIGRAKLLVGITSYDYDEILIIFAALNGHIDDVLGFLHSRDKHEHDEEL